MVSLTLRFNPHSSEFNWNYLTYFCVDATWLESVGSRVLYPTKPIVFVVPVESILGKLPVIPVGEFGTVPDGMRAQFLGALTDRTAHARSRRLVQTAILCGMFMGSGLVQRDVVHSLLIRPSEHTDAGQFSAQPPAATRARCCTHLQNCNNIKITIIKIFKFKY